MEGFKAPLRYLRNSLRFIKLDLYAKYTFRVSLILWMLDVLSSVTIYYTLGSMMPSQAIKDVSNDYPTFLIIGLSLNQFILINLHQPHMQLSKKFWSRTLPLLLLAPRGLLMMNLEALILAYVSSLFFISCYLIFGLLLTGLQITLNITTTLTALTILILTMLATLGLGLISASMFFLLNAKDVEPLSWVTDIASSVTSGVYFPPELLPKQIHFISWMLPHTYGLKAMRLALAKEYTLPMLTEYILPLLLSTIILIPIGYKLFSYSINKAKNVGGLPNW